MQSKRTEYGSKGAIELPANRYWGTQTGRSIHNFPHCVGRFKQSPILVESLGILKKCAAQANAELDELPDNIAKIIQEAAQEVIDGKLNDEFPLVVFQAGSGTQSKMDSNEVIANAAIEIAGGEIGSKSPVHP